MPLSSVHKQTEEVLDNVLLTIRQEYENPFPVLSETDRNKFVEEEESLRKQLGDTVESGSSSWRGLLCLPSPQALKCLKNAQELSQRVKEDINAKVRTRLTGKSNPPLSPSWHGHNSAMNPIRTSTPTRGGPLAVGHPGPASTIITSPLNMRCSLSEPEVSEGINGITAPSDYGTCPLETSSESSDRSGDASGRRRRTPPPPPLRRIAPPGNSRPFSEISSSSGSDSPRRSSSVRRPAPPPPQSPRRSRTPRSPTNTSFISSGPLSPDSAMISSISRLSRHMSTLGPSIEASCRQAQGGRSIKTNCMEFIGSNADGVTLNTGGKNNSGAVIHKTMVAPPRLPQHVP